MRLIEGKTFLEITEPTTILIVRDRNGGDWHAIQGPVPKKREEPKKPRGILKSRKRRRKSN
jgi:hypothetical protein